MSSRLASIARAWRCLAPLGDLCFRPRTKDHRQELAVDKLLDSLVRDRRHPPESTESTGSHPFPSGTMRTKPMHIHRREVFHSVSGILEVKTSQPFCSPQRATPALSSNSSKKRGAHLSRLAHANKVATVFGLDAYLRCFRSSWFRGLVVVLGRRISEGNAYGRSDVGFQCVGIPSGSKAEAVKVGVCSCIPMSGSVCCAVPVHTARTPENRARKDDLICNICTYLCTYIRS